MEISRAYRDADTDQIEAGSLVQEAAYDGLGRRIIRRVKNSADRNITEHHYYAGQSVVEIRNGSDMVLKQKVWAGTFQAGYIDQLIQSTLNADPIENPAMEREPANPAYAPRDHWAMTNANFNVAALVDENGAVAERYEYTPYGQRQVYISPGLNDPLAYAPTGQSRRWQVDGEDQPYGLNSVGHQGLMHDEHLNSRGGLVHNRARTLHPRLGRFMQRDPLDQNQPGGGYQDGMSLYQYVRGNPITQSDLSGLLSITYDGNTAEISGKGITGSWNSHEGGRIRINWSEFISLSFFDLSGIDIGARGTLNVQTRPNKDDSDCGNNETWMPPALSNPWAKVHVLPPGFSGGADVAWGNSLNYEWQGRYSNYGYKVSFSASYDASMQYEFWDEKLCSCFIVTGSIGIHMENEMNTIEAVGMALTGGMAIRGIKAIATTQRSAGPAIDLLRALSRL